MIGQLIFLFSRLEPSIKQNNWATNDKNWTWSLCGENSLRSWYVHVQLTGPARATFILFIIFTMSYISRGKKLKSYWTAIIGSRKGEKKEEKTKEIKGKPKHFSLRSIYPAACQVPFAILFKQIRSHLTLLETFIAFSNEGHSILNRRHLAGKRNKFDTHTHKLVTGTWQTNEIRRETDSVRSTPLCIEMWVILYYLPMNTGKTGIWFDRFEKKIFYCTALTDCIII